MHFYLVDDDNSSKVIVAHSKDEAWRAASKHDFGDPVDPEAFYEITMLAPNHYKKVQIIVEERENMLMAKSKSKSKNRRRKKRQRREGNKLKRESKNDGSKG